MWFLLATVTIPGVLVLLSPPTCNYSFFRLNFSFFYSIFNKIFQYNFHLKQFNLFFQENPISVIIANLKFRRKTSNFSFIVPSNFQKTNIQLLIESHLQKSNNNDHLF